MSFHPISNIGWQVQVEHVAEPTDAPQLDGRTYADWCGTEHMTNTTTEQCSSLEFPTTGNVLPTSPEWSTKHTGPG
jgi:hypothetical protein